MTTKLPPALNRVTTERLLDLGHEMHRAGRSWWIDGRPIHGNAARTILADGIRSKTLESLGDQRWRRRAPKVVRYCEQIAEHIVNNNIPAALDLLQELDAALANPLTSSTLPLEMR